MQRFALVWLALAMSASVAEADSITVNGFNNNTAATVTFNDGAGHSGSNNTLLTQFNVTLTGVGSPITFDTFSIDLFHTVTAGQTYLVNARGDLATALVNGSRIAYIFQTYGLPDLTNNPDQAAAVQLALWDLSLNNHNPTSFQLDVDGTYSSGDENVFNVSFGSNPHASQIAGLTAQFLSASIGITTQGGWFDASAAGSASNRGESLLQPVPEPSSGLMTLLGIGALSAWGLWCRHRRVTFRRRPNSGQRAENRPVPHRFEPRGEQIHWRDGEEPESGFRCGKGR
jgi:hypothetical protein